MASPLTLSHAPISSKRGAHLVGNGAVGARAEVEQQVAVLADDIDELMDEEFGRLEGVVLDVSPAMRC